MRRQRPLVLRCESDSGPPLDVSFVVFFFSSRRRHTRFDCDWSSDVCSSDLPRPSSRSRPGSRQDRRPGRAALPPGQRLGPAVKWWLNRPGGACGRHLARSTRRSEEHTSELQSQSNLVCRLLLEKKKHTTDDTSKKLRYKIHQFMDKQFSQCLNCCDMTIIQITHSHSLRCALKTTRDMQSHLCTA